MYAYSIQVYICGWVGICICKNSVHENMMVCVCIYNHSMYVLYMYMCVSIHVYMYVSIMHICTCKEYKHVGRHKYEYMYACECVLCRRSVCKWSAHAGLAACGQYTWVQVNVCKYAVYLCCAAMLSS